MSQTLTNSNLRSIRLQRLFGEVTCGKKPVKTKLDAALFLEAICNQEDRAHCAEKLTTTSDGLRALKQSLRSDVTINFINKSSATFINYIADDTVRQLGNGKPLQDILVAIVEPPMFWFSLMKAYKDKELSNPDGLRAFAYLLFDLLVLWPPSLSMEALQILDVAEDALSSGGGLLDSSDDHTRLVSYKLQNIIQSRKGNSAQHSADTFMPGGRHDNDHEDFRQIAIFPTRDEFLAKDQPFYLPSDAILEMPPEDRVSAHLDNQFRLLREDMLAELRHDISKTPRSKRGKNTSLRVKDLSLQGVNLGDSVKRRSATLALQCRKGLSNVKLNGMDKAQRKKYFDDTRTLLKHQSFGCLLHSGDIVAFATIDRNTDLLAEDIPVILLRIFGQSAVQKSLIALKVARSEDLEFAQVDTPYFAYEPVLKRLQSLPFLPLSGPLLSLDGNMPVSRSIAGLEDLATCIRQNEGSNLRKVLQVPKNVTLDHSQTESLATGLTQQLSLIQGPPGTGKSFIGAILAKSLLEHTEDTILVLCFTNHALDQFLEDILGMGVSENHMVRLGSKSTARTQSLGLREQSSSFRRSRQSGALMAKCRDEVDEFAADVQKQASSYSQQKVSHDDILQYLLFSDQDSEFFYAFTVPDDADGMTKVGKKGKTITPTYLISRWLQDLDAGIYTSMVEDQHQKIWKMDPASRSSTHARWVHDLFSEHAALLSQSIDGYGKRYDRLNDMMNERDTEIVRSKRIIGCTTTAAAKYSDLLSSARPGIVLVEEAGEILESHVLTALSPDTKQIILIGDHQQLRPKVNNFALTIEKGDGYDLNRSLFERLVIGGYPHVVLTKQHRMRPEISALVRRLMYPQLEDGPKTQNRPNLRGFQSNVIFLNHDHGEKSIENLSDRRDENSTISRENLFEVKIVLKTVRYLAQQGYNTEKQVVLTPYLGQLRLLLEHLRADHDPVLNDLDSFDLVRAGLLPPASASVAKRPLRISTIDNYQGEESEVVIVSLTRSNNAGDIGFLAQAQRLNVLLSRARNGLIIIGNSKTFETSRKGHPVWRPFFEQLAEAGYIYDGLPVKCERHPHKTALLKTVEDFDRECPDGGCSEPCTTILNCGKHTCTQSCHQLVDHSKVQCEFILEDKCSKGHKITWKCWQKSTQCTTCDREARKIEAQRQRDHRLEAQRLAKEQAYAQRLAELDNEISHELRLQKERNNEFTRQKVLDQRKKDLEQARAKTKHLLDGDKQPTQPSAASPKATVASPYQPNKTDPPPSTGTPNETMSEITSQAKEEWEYQKACENASNEHLDALMGMIGLETVKQHFLTIKNKIDTSVRQNTSLQSERFGAVLLGNPGTGKTTVARIYANFLASVGALSGTTVKETTAARLAADGVSGCKTLIEEVLNSGGGAIFIDEAYQLASQTSGGTQILDFLLPEVENLTGKVVFILAGYRKQMESFFAHNPGLPSRFPQELQFHDYDDTELLHILGYQINKYFEGRMSVEDGIKGLYCRIAARRVGYGRGRDGFGNARALENAFVRIRNRQAKRLQAERRRGEQPSDMLLTKTDIIGPEPSKALGNNKAWRDLQGMIGLDAVKQSVEALLETIQYNYLREIDEKALLQFNLNRVFLGSPGTGKTTVAKLYGQILTDIGFLSNGEVVVKNPSDFIGDVIGASERNTKGVLASTVGKVLVIDEAYALYGGSTGGGSGNGGGIFGTAVIDTLVAEVQSVPGDDRCVLLLGYKDQMETMFQNVNPGLNRRFPLADAFNFEDFTNDQMRVILANKLKQQGYDATGQAMNVATEVLTRARNRPNFGNAGEVDILLNTAKSRHQQRRTKGRVKGIATLEAVDMDPEFNRGEHAATNIRMLFKDVIGCDELITQFEGYQKVVANMKARGLDAREQIPFNMLFRGPPGTGKTTTAKKMGKIYMDMGFLATAEVIETSATDLIGEYMGQTGPKTQKLLEKAMGKVLFIDEAYRLAEGHFAKEAMDELVDCLTKPAFYRRLIVILAGYDADINRLMRQNPGLTSRFPDSVNFRHLEPRDCLALLTNRLRKKPVDTSVLDSPSEGFTQDLLSRFDTLTKTDNWANARDVNYVASCLFNRLVRDAESKTGKFPLYSAAVLETLDSMIAERNARRVDASAGAIDPMPRFQQAAPPRNMPDQPSSTTAGTSTQQTNRYENSEPLDEKPLSPIPVVQPVSQDPRDPGVDNATWAALENDKKAAKRREEEYAKLLAEQLKKEAENERKSKEEDLENEQRQEELQKLNQQCLTADAIELQRLATAANDARRRFEQERLTQELARRERQEELDRRRREKERREEERRKEQVAQSKLRSAGLCMAGYRWIKQSSGYRCAGGSHFMSNEQLDRL